MDDERVEQPAPPAPASIFMRGSDRAWGAAIFLSAFAIRFAYVLTDLELPTINDMGAYSQLAASLVAGDGYVSELEPHHKSLRAPGYPFFLAAVYSTFGESGLAVLTLHALLGAGTCLVVFHLGRDLAGRATGVVAGLLCVVNPEALHWTRELVTETLFTFLLATGVYGGVQLWRTGQKRWMAVTGLALGYATLVRANVLLFLPFMVAFLLLATHRTWRWRATACAVVVGLFVVVLTPWTIRNYRVHGEFVPVASIGGLSLFVSLPIGGFPRRIWRLPKKFEQGHHRSPNGYDMSKELMGLEPNHAMPDDFDELEESRRGREIYLRYAMANPGHYAMMVVAKLSAVFNPLPRPFPSRYLVDYGFGRTGDIFVRYTAGLFYFGFFLLAALGAISMFAWRSPVLLLYGLLAYQVGFMLVFRPALRYLLPGLVVLSVFAAAGALVAQRLPAWLAEAPERRRLMLAAWGALASLLTANAYFHVFVLNELTTTRDMAILGRLIGLD